MPERIRFGPAGKPVGMKSGDYVKAIEYVANEGLDALEYEAVRGVRISEKKAVEIKRAALEHGILLSMHAPYFINLASPNEDTVKKSQQRLLDALKAANWMGAYVVVFHPGYYKDNPSKEAALKRVIENLKPVVEQAKQLGIKGVELGPETTGKRAQVGDIDEVITICREVEMCRPVVDWAHIYARYRGQHVTSIDQVLKVIEKIEKELGSRAVNPLHTHFSRIEYGEGGEREHHTLDEAEYGPEFRIVCEAYKQAGIRAVIISESPILDQDALKMKKICCEELGYC
ncbi:Xylose isomerase domain-containing protein TIM barrel [Pyrolobus fumarii 1A]|uniref:Xylose isomerase domain-containing protein TIM barrel n=1 Tax=Pyrolobus fumarii (strain DSM 11204 / 1A) TaxID=694429 RepID=G0EHF8_PYRF1|nr:TIM barrel protein [Pyrolobus fumarii]AEM38533.1 Xylose isomerase domain-containing protein TIM barrel [Pyrolobus fumarii 1A]